MILYTFSAICNDIVHTQTEKELGFNAFLKTLHAKVPYRLLISQVCSPLLFHPVADISHEILKYGFGTTFDMAPKDAAIDHITHHYKDHIQHILSVHSFRDYSKSLACYQCSQNDDKWHEVWEGSCENERHVVVSFERPVEGRMKGIRLGADAQTLKNDIEILKILNRIVIHPNIIQLLAYHTLSSPVFYVAESLSTSMTLSQFLLYRRNVRPALTLLDLMQSGVLPMVSAVQFCHESGVLLRNVTASAFLAKDFGATFAIKLHAFHLARMGNVSIPSPVKKNEGPVGNAGVSKLRYIGMCTS